MTERPTVCLILEGSYPYITGGVSAWVHQLIRYLEDINFVLYTISPAKDQPRRYELPANVVGHSDMVLSEPTRGRHRPGNVRALLDEIVAIHDPLREGVAPELDKIVRQIPTGYSVYADCLLYTSPSPRDRQRSRMPSSA